MLMMQSINVYAYVQNITIIYTVWGFYECLRIQELLLLIISKIKQCNVLVGGGLRPHGYAWWYLGDAKWFLGSNLSNYNNVMNW